MDTNLEIIVGTKEEFTHVNRHVITIDQHLAKEWNRDIGKPMCVYNIKKMIVELRRSSKPDGQQFESYLNTYKDIIIPNLNSRWLLSITDTFADVVRGPRQINATWISAHFKLSLVSDSLLHYLTNWEINRNNILDRLPIQPSNDPEQKLFADTKPIPGLEGQTAISNVKSDIIPNIDKRLHSILHDDEILLMIYRRLEELYNNADTTKGLWNKLEHEG